MDAGDLERDQTLLAQQTAVSWGTFSVYRVHQYWFTCVFPSTPRGVGVVLCSLPSLALPAKIVHTSDLPSFRPIPLCLFVLVPLALSR